MRSLTRWIFAAVLTDRSRPHTLFPINVAHPVDVFTKIAKHTSAPISCWKFTHHLKHYNSLSAKFVINQRSHIYKRKLHHWWCHWKNI